MTNKRNVPDALRPLIDAAFNGSITVRQADELKTLLRSDREARRAYCEYSAIETGLFLLIHGRKASEAVSERLHADAIDAHSARQAAIPPSVPAVGYPSATFLGTVGLSSGWPVAYLIATVIFAVGLLAGTVIHVSRPDARPQLVVAAAHPRPSGSDPSSAIARVTAMVDCVWEGAAFRVQGSGAAKHPAEIINDNSRLQPGDRLALRSGLLELAYTTGAKVTLQGPVTYVVESPAGGYLSAGRLTARLEKMSEVRGQRLETVNQKSKIINQTFVVRTPTAVVTDLGTEFGVDVDASGQSDVCVHSGKVTVQGAGAAASSAVIVLKAGEAKRIPSSDSASWLTIDAKDTRVARPLVVSRPTINDDAAGELLFFDHFQSFSLGEKWRAVKGAPPNAVLQAGLDGDRTVLSMRSATDDMESKAIETVVPIPLDGLKGLTVEMLFQAREGVNPPLELHVVGAAAAARMIVQPLTREGSHRIAADASCSGKWHSALSSPEVYSDYRYYRFVLTLDGKGVLASFKDSVNAKPLWEACFDKVRLSDFGGEVRIVLCQLTHSTSSPAECNVDRLFVRGRRSGDQRDASFNAKTDQHRAERRP